MKLRPEFVESFLAAAYCSRHVVTKSELSRYTIDTLPVYINSKINWYRAETAGLLAIIGGKQYRWKEVYDHPNLAFVKKCVTL